MSEFSFDIIPELKNMGYNEGALATVIKSADGTPRHLGAKMIVLSDGTTIGTISGGTMEYTVINKCNAVIKDGNPIVFRYSLYDDLGMLCGGDAHILIEKVVF